MLGMATAGLLSSKSNRNKAKDLLFGKKDPGSAGYWLDSRTPTERSLAERTAEARLRSLRRSEDASHDYMKGIGAQVEAEKRQAIAGQEDQRRRLSSLLARRGLTGSSIGLQQEMALEKDKRRRLAEIVASRPMREAQGRIAGANMLRQAAYSMPGTAQPAYVKGRESRGRSGGLVKLGLTALGAYKGGAGGAQAGAGAGDAIANW